MFPIPTAEPMQARMNPHLEPQESRLVLCVKMMHSFLCGKPLYILTAYHSPREKERKISSLWCEKVSNPHLFFLRLYCFFTIIRSRGPVLLAFHPILL